MNGDINRPEFLLKTYLYDNNIHKTPLNLACGKLIQTYWDNVDLFEFEQKRIRFNTNFIQQDLFKDNWNLKDNHYDYIYCSHFFEHIPTADIFFTIMKNIHRIAKNHCVLDIRVPYPKVTSFIDVTHCRLIDLKTFKFWMGTNTFSSYRANERVHMLSLIKRVPYGQYHIQKYLKLSIPPYYGLRLVFDIIKE
jgi:predicted SAM-dependent methyltransferase